jgi:hypothetical protein
MTHLLESALDACSTVHDKARPEWNSVRRVAWQDACAACMAEVRRTLKPVSHPSAYIEHHKGGDNLVWEQTTLPCTPLYKTVAA